MNRLIFLSALCYAVAVIAAPVYAVTESRQNKPKQKFLRCTIMTKQEKVHPLKHEEHPEHPEHPKHPKKSEKEKPSLTADELADAIKKYVDEQNAEKDGYFEIYDDEADKTLTLSLIRVHRERLAKVGEDLYFACADFNTPEDITYDLDFFMKGKNKDNLEFTDVSIHKEDGKERYTWYEEDGIWKKKPVEAPPKEARPKKHREQPQDPNEQTPEHQK